MDRKLHKTLKAWVKEMGKAQIGPGQVQRIVRWLRRRYNHFFVKRLAINVSKMRTVGGKKCPDVHLYEWQKMPFGYRWF
jgi:hypothetical protein